MEYNVISSEQRMLLLRFSLGVTLKQTKCLKSVYYFIYNYLRTSYIIETMTANSSYLDDFISQFYILSLSILVPVETQRQGVWFISPCSFLQFQLSQNI